MFLFVLVMLAKMTWKYEQQDCWPGKRSSG